MELEALELKRTYIRNEIAFIVSERCHGGPDKSIEMAHWQEELKEAEDEIARETSHGI